MLSVLLALLPHPAVWDSEGEADLLMSRVVDDAWRTLKIAGLAEVLASEGVLLV